MTNAIILHPRDSVAIVTNNVFKGDSITFIDNDGNIKTLQATTNVPVYHKVAIKYIKKGEYVYKYGEIIGYATKDINMGEHVHEHNLESVITRNQ